MDDAVLRANVVRHAPRHQRAARGRADGAGVKGAEGQRLPAEGVERGRQGVCLLWRRRDKGRRRQLPAEANDVVGAEVVAEDVDEVRWVSRGRRGSCEAAEGDGGEVKEEEGGEMRRLLRRGGRLAHIAGGRGKGREERGGEKRGEEGRRGKRDRQGCRSVEPPLSTTCAAALASCSREGERKMGRAQERGSGKRQRRREEGD